ncbi:MAG: geranylgeranylglycerol-phosphate geranylgeranyltransferase [Bacteroidia bacterium]
MDFLKLIRFPNLLMIALTQYLVRFTIITPILSVSGMNSALSNFDFFLLVFSTVLIAAGGYIINDINDFQIDALNKPENVIVGKRIDKNLSNKIHLLLSGTGVALGCYLSFIREIPNVWMINLLSTGLLWMYSSQFKKIIVAGNFIISFLAALSIIIILLADKNAYAAMAIRKLICGYTVFAFVITMIREVIKDMEDAAGDKAFGRKTIPVVMGNMFSKYYSAFLVLVILFSIAIIQYYQRQWEDKVSFIYVVLFIELPLAALLFFLFRSKEKKDFSRLSLLAKGIMFTGILSMLVFYLRYK